MLESKAIEFNNIPLIDIEVYSRQEYSEIYTRDFINQLFKAFKRDAALDIQKIKKSIEHNDQNDYRDMLHALKGAAGNINASRLAAICKYCREYNYGNDFKSESIWHLEEISECLIETEAAIEKYIHSLVAPDKG